jgi:NADH dehydrogenase
MLCEPDMRVKGYQNVWGIGDCSVNPNPAGGSFPPTAQFAVLEGKHAAKNIARVLRAREATVPHFRSRGMLAAFGRFDAVANVFGIRLTGFPAWFLWRSVYLMKMPGIGRKIRVAIDWTLDLFVGRDYVELGVHRAMQGGRTGRHHETDGAPAPAISSPPESPELALPRANA